MPGGSDSRIEFHRLTFRGRHLGARSNVALPSGLVKYKKVQKWRLKALKNDPIILGISVLFLGQLHRLLIISVPLR